MENTKKSKELNGKDLMNIGIFTALYLVIEILIACTVGMIPIGFMLIAFLTAIITGIPMILYFTRIKKFGMVMITLIINGAMMILTGMGIDALLFGLLFGLIAELILRSGKYQSSTRTLLAFAVFSMTGAASYFHWINASTDWLAQNAASYGEDYMNTIAGFFDYWWMFPVLLLSAFAGGIIGGLLGKAVLKKHFVKSGMV